MTVTAWLLPFRRMDDSGTGRSTISLICVVDDDESIRDALGSLIRSVGYECAVFPSAKAFLDSGRLAETDCLVLDVHMAGLSGPELQLTLREMNYGFPIIFLSARMDDELRAKVLELGAAAALDKPFSHRDLLDAIRSALDPES
jgi:FixJ family two-component response regulator